MNSNKLHVLVVLLIIIVLLSNYIECLSPSSFIYNKVYNNQNKKKHNSNDLEYQIFNQRIDHFNYQHYNLTFQQRYLVNYDYYDGNYTSPIFFVFSGEQELDDSIVTYRQYVKWAEKLNAMVVSLEHRYYGKSNITDNLTTESLQYLNSEQALADCSNFITWFKEENGIADNTKWVGFGASYGGTIAAQFKIKYPHLINVIISSSGPVYPELNFYQYLEVIQNSIQVTVKNGRECTDSISNATKEIENLVNLGEQLTIKEKFKLCNPLENPKDISLLGFSSSLVYMDAIQYYDGDKDKIQKICDIMTNKSNNPLDNYIQVWLQMSYPNQTCININYNDHINSWQKESVNQQSKAWMYQTCTEYGYFMTTEGTNQPFSSLFNLEFYTDMCEDIFEIKNMFPNTKWTIDSYGGFNPSRDTVDKILYINSGLDPWYPLGFTPTINKEGIHTLFIEGLHAHCADIFVQDENTEQDIINAHNSIFNFIKNNLQ